MGIAGGLVSPAQGGVTEAVLGQQRAAGKAAQRAPAKGGDFVGQKCPKCKREYMPEEFVGQMGQRVRVCRRCREQVWRIKARRRTEQPVEIDLDLDDAGLGVRYGCVAREQRGLAVRLGRGNGCRRGEVGWEVV